MGLADLSFELVAAFGSVQAVITGLVVFLGRIWINRIHEQDRARLAAELEAVRAERERDKTILEAAFSVLSMSHGAAYQKRVEAVSELWKAIILIRENTPPLVNISDVLVWSEYGDIIKNPRLQTYRNGLTEHATFSPFELTKEVEEHRPFMGTVLWSLFFAYRALTARTALLFY